LTKLSGFFDLVGDPGGQLAQRGHLFGLDQPCPGRFQVVVSGFGGVPCGVDFGLRPLALGDVAVDQHKTAAGHRVVAYFEHPAVRPRALERVVPTGILGVAAKLGLRVGRCAELAALRQISHEVGVGVWLDEERIRQVEDLDEIAVPGGQPQLLIEPGDTIAHIVESDAQDRLPADRVRRCAPRPGVPAVPRPRRASAKSASRSGAKPRRRAPIAAILVAARHRDGDFRGPPPAMANIAPLIRFRRRTMLRPT